MVVSVAEVDMGHVTGLAALGADAYLAGDEGATTEAAERDNSIGARLAAARKAAGLSGAQLGAALGLGKDQISKIERGKRRLDVSELVGAASALGTSVRALLGVPDRPHLALAARLATGAAPGVVRPAHRRARQLLEIDDLLTRAVDLPAAAPSQAGAEVILQARALSTTVPRSTAAARLQGTTAAMSARGQLQLGSAGLVDLAGLCEQHFGADVVLAPWGEQVDGLCVHSGDAALLMASTDFPDGHLRFTLAHELAHHVFADPREVIDESVGDMFADDLVEKRANAFAGHLLMPQAGVDAMLTWLGEQRGQVGERSVVHLMEHFGVSLTALVFQLNALGWIGFEDGQRLRSRGVGYLLSQHRDAAPSGAAAQTHRVRRAPERLVRHALDAARTQRLGLSVVAALLEREDDEALWSEIMSVSPTETGSNECLTDDDIML
jgi:Zn-dependent peptidase ImmA (M78 family)/transcriptional regulator with XRE-family HTH domain